MGRSPVKSEAKHSYFILKVTETHQRVSFSVHEPSYRDGYFLTFKTIKVICESIPPSDKLDIPLHLDLACDKRPLVTVQDVEKTANDDLWNQDFPNFQMKDKARNKLMKEYQPKGIGHMHKHNGVLQSYILLQPDLWMAAHVLLCSGKPCFISLSAYREYRQRDYIVSSVAVSTEPEE